MTITALTYVKEENVQSVGADKNSEVKHEVRLSLVKDHTMFEIFYDLFSHLIISRLLYGVRNIYGNKVLPLGQDRRISDNSLNEVSLP